MRQMIKKALITLLSISVLLLDSNVARAESNNIIIFKDKNLQSALSDYYDWNKDFTKEKASELSKKKNYLILDYSNVSDLEGLQYFDNLIQVVSRGNALSNMCILPKLKDLYAIDISYNSINGKKFESIMGEVGNITKLDTIYLMNDDIADVSLLGKIGDLNNYYDINMENNQICEISILEDAINLKRLDLSNNRITDISPLKKLNKLTFYLDLRDNCIIDFKPIKPLLDEMFSDPGNETGLERYDYYTNPVNFKYNGKTIKFPYLTAYYKYQAYAEAIPLFNAFGGSAKYNKKTGTLTCNYGGNVFVFKDFSKKYTLNGEEKSLKYPMRRMQYDLAYVPVKDICEILGLNYIVAEKRVLSNNDRVFARPPKNVAISSNKKK